MAGCRSSPFPYSLIGASQLLGMGAVGVTTTISRDVVHTPRTDDMPLAGVRLDQALLGMLWLWRTGSAAMVKTMLPQVHRSPHHGGSL